MPNELDKGYVRRKTNTMKKTDKNKDKEVWIPPDGGYGWVIVGCSFMILVLFAAFSQLGVFLLELQESFQVSKTTITWINAAHTATGRILGIIIGPFLHHVGSRWVTMIGVILLAAGFFLSSFVHTIPLLFLTFGLITSIGYGCMFPSASAVVQQYFTTKRSLVAGIVQAGSVTGVFIWPPIGQHLVENYGWRRAFQIESAIFLVIGLVIVVFLKSPGNQKLCHCWQRKSEDTLEVKRKEARPTSALGSKRCCSNTFCNLSFLRNPVLSIYWIGTFLMAVGYQVNSVYMPVRGEMMGFSASISAWQSSAMGLAGGLSIVFFAAVGNIPGVNRMLMSAVGVLLSGGQCFASTFITSSTLQLVNAGLLGLLAGTYSAVAFVIVVDIAGVENVAVASGIQTAIFGFAHLFVHPTVGALLDMTDDPQVPFYLGGTAWFLSSIITGVALILRTRTDTTSFHLTTITNSKTNLAIEDRVWKEMNPSTDEYVPPGDPEVFVMHF